MERVPCHPKLSQLVSTCQNHLRPHYVPSLIFSVGLLSPVCPSFNETTRQYMAYSKLESKVRAWFVRVRPWLITLPIRSFKGICRVRRWLMPVCVPSLTSLMMTWNLDVAHNECPALGGAYNDRYIYIYIYSKIGIDSIHSSLKDCSYHGVYPSNPTCHLAPGLKCGIFGLRHTDNCHGIGELSFWGTVEYQLLMCTTILVHPCHEIHMICL